MTGLIDDKDVGARAEVPSARDERPRDARHRVLVVGGGFAGLEVVHGLRRAPVAVTLLDRKNYHLFQPLAYQVATGALSPAEIATPLRHVFKRQANARVLLAEVTGFDLEHREVLVDLANGRQDAALGYDTLVVAGGSHYSYFGHDEWKPFAPELKSLDGALEIRKRLLSAFEAAEVETDEARRGAWLTFVVVGGGPTGVEMAGQIAELGRDTLRRDFRSIDTRAAQVLLVEAARPRPDELPGVALAQGCSCARAAGRHAARRPHRRRRRGRLGCDPLAERRGRAHRRPHGDLGGRRHRLGAGRGARRVSRPGGRSRRSRHRRPPQRWTSLGKAG